MEAIANQKNGSICPAQQEQALLKRCRVRVVTEHGTFNYTALQSGFAAVLTAMGLYPNAKRIATRNLNPLFDIAPLAQPTHAEKVQGVAA